MKIVIRGWDEPNGMPATWTIELSVDAGEEAVVSHGSLERTQNVESNFRAEIEVRYGDVTRQAACHVVGSPGGMTYELLRLASCIARVVDRRDTSESVNLQRVGLHSQDQYTVGSAYSPRCFQHCALSTALLNLRPKGSLRLRSTSATTTTRHLKGFDSSSTLRQERHSPEAWPTPATGLMTYLRPFRLRSLNRSGTMPSSLP